MLCLFVTWWCLTRVVLCLFAIVVSNTCCVVFVCECIVVSNTCCVVFVCDSGV